MDPEKVREVEKKEQIDDETRNWPVEEMYRDALHLISPTHKAVPLRAYHGNTFIEPTGVNNSLRNSIVEIHFSLHHTFLSKQTPPRDTFRADIKQVKVLEEGKDFDTGYTQTDVRSGPLSAFSTHAKRSAPGPSEAESSSRPVKLVKTSRTEATLEGDGNEKKESRASVKGKDKKIEDGERSDSSDTIQPNEA